MIRLRSVIFVLLILSLSVTGCFAAETQTASVGSILAERHGGYNPFFSYHVVLGVEEDEENFDEYFGKAWIYTVLRVYEYPSGGSWYALAGAEPAEVSELAMHHDSGYTWGGTGNTINVNSIPREPTVLKLPNSKYQRNDIVLTKSGTYLLVTEYSTSDDGDVGAYRSCEIRKKADGTWGYVLSSRYWSEGFWDYIREFEASVTQLVTRLPDEYQGIEVVDEFPKVVPITTVAPVVTTARPIQIDTPKGPTTLPPTPVRTEGPSSNPFYPANSPTPVTTLPVVQPVTPFPMQPISPVIVQPTTVPTVDVIPTIMPSYGFGRRYVIGNPGSSSEGRYSFGRYSTGGTFQPRSGTRSFSSLTPGNSRGYGIARAGGSFSRLYPEDRWATRVR